jgi:aromatic ring-opening dioxygenase LigB subunit
MPFGLCNAPSHFQKTVVAIVDKGDIQVVVYLDDIIVYSDYP